MRAAVVRRRAAPILAVLIALELLVGGIDLRGGSRPPEALPARAPTGSHAAGTSTLAQGAPRPPATLISPLDAVRALLDKRAQAVTAHDRAAFMSTVDPKQQKLRLVQDMLFSNLSSVPFSTWSYDVGDNAGLPTVGATFSRYHARVWAAQVELVYGFRGVDPRPTSRDQYLTFVQRGAHWYLGGDSDYAGVGKVSWQGIWNFGPVVTYRGTHSLVLSHPRYAAQQRSIAADVDAAVGRVTAVWGPAWPRRVAVLLPDTQDEMTSVVGGGLDLAHIAAVATADYTNSRTQVARGQRVVINPVHLMSLGVLGRPVVLRHELTHVATRSVTGPDTPAWLAEGFADFVGYHGSGIGVRLAAQELQVEVARKLVPAALPSDKEFAGDDPRLSAVYEEAWMACRLIAAEAGTDGLVRFYRQVGRATGDPSRAVASALRTVLGMSYDAFVRQWRSDLVKELS